MKICLQHNGECVCHHLNGHQGIHNVLQLVLSQNPVWGKPGTHDRHVSHLKLVSLRCESESRRRTLVPDGICEALPEQSSFRWATRSSSAWRTSAPRPSGVCELWGGKCCESSPQPWAGSWPPKTEGEVRVTFLNKVAGILHARAQYRPEHGARPAGAEREGSRPWWRCCRPLRRLYHRPSLGISAAGPAEFPQSFPPSTRPQWSRDTVERKHRMRKLRTESWSCKESSETR